MHVVFCIHILSNSISINKWEAFCVNVKVRYERFYPRFCFSSVTIVGLPPKKKQK